MLCFLMSCVAGGGCCFVCASLLLVRGLLSSLSSLLVLFLLPIVFDNEGCCSFVVSLFLWGVLGCVVGPFSWLGVYNFCERYCSCYVLS